MGDHEGNGNENPEEDGRWEIASDKFASLPVHVAMLHTGKVLAFGGSGNDETRLHYPYRAELWDPQTERIETVKQDLPGDIFCAGHAFLPDGRLLVAGGTSKYDGDFDPFGLISLPPFRGLDHTYLFDPETEQWTRGEDLAHSRWYPTLLTLGDGSVLTAAGLTASFPWVTLRRLERYRPEKGWQSLHGVSRWLPLYPRLHLLPNGNVFYSGSYNTHYTFPFSLKGFPTAVLNRESKTWWNLGLPNQAEREEGTSVLLPFRSKTGYQPRVLLIGGGTPGGDTALASAEIMNLSDSMPRWRTVAPMKHERYYTYAVLLPTGNVLVVGGQSGKAGHAHPPDSDHGDGTNPGEVPHIPTAVREAELFDAETETWTTLASMEIDRLYHSNAVLLPDGRVMTAGSNPRRRENEKRIEIFHPPYLFEGSRPVIHAIPATTTHGTTITVDSPDAGTVDAVTLVRPSSTTHCLNTDQRCVELPTKERRSNSLTVDIPPNPNLLPPGYYMLFLLRDGVPSEAEFIRLDRSRATSNRSRSNGVIGR